MRAQEREKRERDAREWTRERRQLTERMKQLKLAADAAQVCVGRVTNRCLALRVCVPVCARTSARLCSTCALRLAFPAAL